MRVAMTLAAGLVAQVSAIAVSLFSFHKARESFRASRYGASAIFFATALTVTTLFRGDIQPARATFATSSHPANQPMGVAKGIFPGRVVWIHDSAATNENCVPGRYDHGWFLNENNNQTVIERMLSDGIRALTGQTSDTAAWHAIFAYHNTSRGKGEAGYQAGEGIFIKINATSSWSGNINTSDLSKVKNQYYGISETSPQLVLAVLRQLVDTAGVPQSDIWIGDPMRHIYKHCYDLWHPEFPNVHYLDHDGWSQREKAIPSQTAVIRYSDRGSVLRTGIGSGDTVRQDYLYTVFEQTEYLINIPTLKGHKHAGMTAFAKNHFGSQTRDGASHLHNGLVDPLGGNAWRQGYGLYRVQVDLMGHELLGRKNLFYLMDGLWTSDYEIDDPDKWMMTPFDNDWMSSIFVSLDPVAIESVGFDFLRTEFTAARGLATYPQMGGVDDYLHQAADSTAWPTGIIYDPEEDGVPISSLGTHEHWNNPLDKQYTRNLGTGNGIELYVPGSATEVAHHVAPAGQSFRLLPNYPNPFNPKTVIGYQLPAASDVKLVVYDLSGREAAVLVNGYQAPGYHAVSFDGSGLASGMYICRLTVRNISARPDGNFVQTQRMLLLK
jgi:hypothetical protein